MSRMASVLKLSSFALWLISFFPIDTSSEVLTGIVKQPLPPFDPAPNSTVTVYEKDRRTKIAPPDTTDEEGRYRFQITKGKEVVIRAIWRSEKSMPGLTETKVESDPTKADVQLLPPQNADFEFWTKLGRKTAETSGNSIAYSVGDLNSAGVPAASVYGYLIGARQKTPGAFGQLNALQILNSDDSKSIALSLQKAEKQLKEKGSVPSQQDLAVDLGFYPTDQQLMEILAFIAPPIHSDAYSNWEIALEKAKGKYFKQTVIDESSVIKRASLLIQN